MKHKYTIDLIIIIILHLYIISCDIIEILLSLKSLLLRVVLDVTSPYITSL